MISDQQLENVFAKIAVLFVDQCNYGKQSIGLPGSAACGQFVGAKARDLPHRGLHGVAAALRVLSVTESPEARQLVPKLVKYIDHRINPQASAPVDLEPAQIDSDKNVIKLGELLYSLSCVPAGRAPTDALVRSIANRLLSSRREGKGWTYFTNSTDPIDPLPTAFAVLGLCRHGYGPEIGPQIAYLEQAILNDSSCEGLSIHDNSVQIVCLFSLVFRDLPVSQITVKKFRRHFIKQWKLHEPLFSQQLEQTIEYSKGHTNYYIRIPWQLYLLALASVLDPKRLASQSARRMLRSVYSMVHATGFRYPYSGLPISSRTNAILFDVLYSVKGSKKNNFLYQCFRAGDSIRIFFSHTAFSYITIIAFLIATALLVYGWIEKGDTVRDLGSGLAVGLILLVVSFCIERIRKS